MYLFIICVYDIFVLVTKYVAFIIWGKCYISCTYKTVNLLTVKIIYLNGSPANIESKPGDQDGCFDMV